MRDKETMRLPPGLLHSIGFELHTDTEEDKVTHPVDVSSSMREFDPIGERVSFWNRVNADATYLRYKGYDLYIKDFCLELEGEGMVTTMEELFHILKPSLHPDARMSMFVLHYLKPIVDMQNW